MEHELVMVVRKELAIALRDLLQHGLMEVSSVEMRVFFIHFTGGAGRCGQFTVLSFISHSDCIL